jgi:hypothetical protein
VLVVSAVTVGGLAPEAGIIDALTPADVFAGNVAIAADFPHISCEFLDATCCGD